MAIEAIGQPDDTDAAYVEFVERFKNHPNPRVRSLVRLARGFRRRAGACGSPALNARGAP
jgi:hypothetical protein